mgnify:CR=1 FL=1
MTIRLVRRRLSAPALRTFFTVARAWGLSTTEERALLRPIRKMAHEIVDTTALTVHDLRQVFMGLIRGDRRAAPDRPSGARH